jgi:hypothetical protein
MRSGFPGRISFTGPLRKIPKASGHEIPWKAYDRLISNGWKKHKPLVFHLTFNAVSC